VNGCVVYEGAVESAPWYRTFSLDACAALRTATEVRIRIRTLGGAGTGQDGVALETLNLFPTPWPPPPAGAHDLRAAVHIVGGTRERVAHADRIAVDVQNQGSLAWPSAASESHDSSEAALELRWRRLPSGPEDRSQRLRLPHVLHPGDQVRMEVPLVPPPDVAGAGPWDIIFVPVTAEGAEISVDEPCTVRVRATAIDGADSGPSTPRRGVHQASPNGKSSDRPIGGEPPGTERR
jgi:hypothetical protein